MTVLPPVTTERIRLAVIRHQAEARHAKWRFELEVRDGPIPAELDAYESRLLRIEPPTLPETDSSGGQ